MEERLQKFLAESGVASRRKCEEIILSGRVSINDETVTQLGVKVDTEKDTVKFDGNIVKPEEKNIYIMFYKPVGCVCTVKDQFDRKTVMDYINIKERIYPIGRLDYDTSGLLLLTNDGKLAYKLTHPKHNVKKTYLALVKGVPSEEKLQKFRSGLKIDDFVTSPCEITVLKKEKSRSVLKISISEGHNRQVRKMCEAIEHPVLSLKRVATGKLTLGDLQKGCYRHLTKEEVNYLKSL